MQPLQSRKEIKTMAEKKTPTQREVLTLVANGTANEVTKAWAEEMLAKLDERNAKRKNTQSPNQVANEGIKEQILATITANGAMVASELGTALSVSTQKASSLCTLLVNENKLVMGERKVKGKGAVKEYSLPTA